ncbi:TonB-dependent receptor plug domain-containing protein [Niabella hibiscisoli]|nr:TonB-dependent receptor plug domain-containing protein [Niabella hibiscisoli]
MSDSANSPLEGVTVNVKGGVSAGTTDKNGRFTLKLPAGKVQLQFSYVGYENLDAEVPESGTMMVTMKKMDLSMDQIVVVGYGAQKRSKITGAIATVNPEDIQDVPVANIAAALRGRVAGLSVDQFSGRPGKYFFKCKGAYSSSEVGGATSEPLYIVDNMVVGKSTFDNLDPAMVEDISILKDASAAIYGAAGAKGVILITTKKGKAGAPRLSYTGQFGFQDAVRKPEMLSAYEHAKLLNETYRINGTSAGLQFSDADLEYLKTTNTRVGLKLSGSRLSCNGMALI